MAKFTKLKNQIVKLKQEVTKENLEKELISIIRRNQKAILDMNRSQLMRGMDSRGGMLAPYNSKDYARFKKTLNPRGVTDLKLTGSFYENFFVASEIPLIIFSYDPKTDELIKKYGKAIFGLTADNKHAFMVGYVRKDLQNYYKRIFHLR